MKFWENRYVNKYQGKLIHVITSERLVNFAKSELNLLFQSIPAEKAGSADYINEVRQILDSII